MPTLADIYSAIDSAKRRASDFVQNPGTSLQQMLGNANDRARNFNQLSSQSTDAMLQAIKSGQPMGQDPATQQLIDIYASSYNPVGMTTSYRGLHTAPGPDFGAPLHDLTGGGQMFPDDIYSSKAAQYYGHSIPYDQKAVSIAQQYRNKPNATVTIYRAVPSEITNLEKLTQIEKDMAAFMRRGTVPKNSQFENGNKWYEWAHGEREKLRNLPDEPTTKTNINPGDWITLTREYAKDHGESALKGQYKILSKKVKAKDVWTNADSIHEFGYHPTNE